MRVLTSFKGHTVHEVHGSSVWRCFNNAEYATLSSLDGSLPEARLPRTNPAFFSNLLIA